MLFLLGIKRMASPVTARSGICWAGIGMVIATVATFADLPAAAQSRADHRRHRDRHRADLDLGQEGRDDRHAADGRAVQRHGRRFGGGDRRRSNCCEIHASPARAMPSHGDRSCSPCRRADRRDLDDGFGHRLGQARRAHGQALHVPAASSAFNCAWSRSAPWCWAAIVFMRSSVPIDHRVLPARARVRRADDAADRRRRHAGGDLAVQRADRSGGRVRRLRAAATRR